MLNLSAFLNQLRQLSALQPKATFWFGAVLSLLQENEHKQIQDDTDTPQKA